MGEDTKVFFSQVHLKTRFWSPTSKTVVFTEKAFSDFPFLFNCYHSFNHFFTLTRTNNLISLKLMLKNVNLIKLIGHAIYTYYLVLLILQFIIRVNITFSVNVKFNF